MFSRSLRAALFALVASSVVVSAAPGLSVKVAGPDSVDGVENFKVKTTVTNTGDEILTILNHPNSPLNKLPADTFKITDATGSTPQFTGIKVKYVLAKAAEAGKDAVTVLPPGKSIEVTHDLSKAYSFTKAGEGAYSIEANKLFYIVDSQKQVAQLFADTVAHTAKLTGKLVVVPSKLTRRNKYDGCTAAQQTKIVSAIATANGYAEESLVDLNIRTSGFLNSHFENWFGKFDVGHHATVREHFSLIRKRNFSSYTYDCECEDAGVFAYVFPEEFETIYLCGAFWKAPVLGVDSQGGTLIHEASHFIKNGGTDDFAYGQDAAMELAELNPAEAIFNADNHEYYSENFLTI